MIKPLTMVSPTPLSPTPVSDVEPVSRTTPAHRSPDRMGQLGAVLGGLALVVSIVTVLQAGSNADLQTTAVQAQQQVAKARALANVDNELVGLLAKAAAENHDDAIRSLLAQNGVTFKAGPAPTAPAAAPSSSSVN